MAGPQLLVTQALLLRKVTFRESDAMLTLFTQSHGKLSALARSAARSQRRFGGSLEPIHTLRVELSPRRNDGLELLSCQVERARLGLTRSLERLEAAGTVLGWLRKAAPERQAEPLVWTRTVGLLDLLDQDAEFDGRLALAGVGLGLLRDWGWGLELEGCVRCGKACPKERPAFVDAGQGGVICTACGGARVKLEASARGRLAKAARGEEAALLPTDAALALTLVEAALSAHADIH